MAPQAHSLKRMASHDDTRSEDGEQEPDFKPLTPEEARELRKKYPPLSPFRVIAWQVLLGLLAAVMAWWATGRASVGWSALYGAAVVVLPTALFARGVLGRGAAGGSGAALARMFGWELVKIVVAVAMMLAAPRVVAGLSWLAMLLAMVLVMKAYWIAFWVHSRSVAANK